MLQIFLKSIKDILSPSVFGFILKVSLGAFVLMAFLFWLFWGSFSRLVAAAVAHIPFVGSFSLFQNGSSFLAALLIAYGLISVVISLLTSLYSPKLLLKLAKKEYGIIGKDNARVTKSIYYNLKSGVVFLILLVLLLPLVFVPIVGQIVMTALWALLLKNPTLYDVSSLFDKTKKGYFGDKSIWIIAVAASLFNYIPILNLFAPLFAQIMFMHWLLPRVLKH